MSKTATLQQARAAKAKAARMVSGHPDVNGVGITRDGDGYAVKLNLSARSKADPLPRQIDGVKVRTEVVGSIRKREPARKAVRAKAG
jgi:hypothetical protein